MIGKCNTGGENVTPEVTTQTPIIQNITEALVGKAMGANATAETILEGYSAYVGQQLVNGTLAKGIPLYMLNCTKYATDTFTPTSRTSLTNLYISHSLGEKPKVILIDAINPTSTVSGDTISIKAFHSVESYSGHGEVVYYGSSANLMADSNIVSDITASNFRCGGSNQYCTAGQLYRVITMA